MCSAAEITPPNSSPATYPHLHLTHTHQANPTNELHLQPLPNATPLLLICTPSQFSYIPQASLGLMSLLPEPPKSWVVTGGCHHPVLLLKEKLRRRVFLELCTRFYKSPKHDIPTSP